MLGSGGVGKSALTLRFVRDYFVKDWDPTIEDAYRKTLDVDEKLCMLEILDTAGQDDFESLRAQWMMDKDGYMFVYSMDSRVSLHELQPFFDLHMQINEGKRQIPPIIMVANKKDLVVGAAISPMIFSLKIFVLGTRSESPPSQLRRRPPHCSILSRQVYRNQCTNRSQCE